MPLRRSHSGSSLANAEPGGYASHPKAKLLKRITDLITVEIPADPGGPLYEAKVKEGMAGSPEIL